MIDNTCPSVISWRSGRNESWCVKVTRNSLSAALGCQAMLSHILFELQFKSFQLNPNIVRCIGLRPWEMTIPLFKINRKQRAARNTIQLLASACLTRGDILMSLLKFLTMVQDEFSSFKSSAKRLNQSKSFRNTLLTAAFLRDNMFVEDATLWNRHLCPSGERFITEVLKVFTKHQVHDSLIEVSVKKYKR